MKIFDIKHVEELTKKLEAAAKKDKKYLKKYMEAAVDQSKGKARPEELLFAYCIARSQYLWGQLTDLGKDGAFFSLLGQNFPSLKKIPLLGRLIENAEEKKGDQKEQNKEWREVLEKSNPVFAYKLKEENVLVREAFGDKFDFYFCNSASLNYERWKKELLEYSEENGDNHFLNDFYFLLSMLASEKQMESVLNKDAGVFNAMSQNARWITSPLSFFVEPALSEPEKFSQLLCGHPVIPRMIDEYFPNKLKNCASLFLLEQKTGIFTDLFRIEDEAYVHSEMLFTLSPAQLYKLFKVKDDELQNRVLGFVLSQLEKGQENTVTLIEFFGSVDASKDQGLFDLLDGYREGSKAQQKRYQAFLDNLRMLAEKDGFVSNFSTFLSKVFNNNEVFLIREIFMGLAKNYDEFSALMSKSFCTMGHIADNITVPETMEAFAKHKLPLDEILVGNILRALADGQLMMVIADETIEIYVKTLSAYVNKFFTKVDLPQARDLLATLYFRDSTRERFFPTMTRKQFVNCINACAIEDGGNAYRLSATFFKELAAVEGGKTHHLSSVLTLCMRQVSHPVFYLELFKRPGHCEAVFKRVKTKGFCKRFNDVKFDREDIAKELAPYAKKILGNDANYEDLLPQNYNLRCELGGSSITNTQR